MPPGMSTGTTLLAAEMILRTDQHLGSIMLMPLYVNITMAVYAIEMLSTVNPW